jgi:hypothetical protein
VTVHSRGWSESASDTPGCIAPETPHPEGVHAPRAPASPCATPSATPCNCTGHHPCKGCPPEATFAHFEARKFAKLKAESERIHHTRDPTPAPA